MKVGDVVVRGGDDGRGSGYVPGSVGRALEILGDGGVLEVNPKVCYDEFFFMCLSQRNGIFASRIVYCILIFLHGIC